MPIFIGFVKQLAQVVNSGMEEITMRNLKYYPILTCSLLLILSLSMLAQAQTLLGQWTFEPGKELVDLKKNFGDIKLTGATVSKGQLVLGTNKWGITTGYTGPDITEKTLVAWLYIDDLDIKLGAPLAINRSSSDHFDAIVYAERQPRRFMAGSSNFTRTQDAIPGFEEKETGKLIYLAISYEDSKGQAHVRIYRNTDLIGDYTQGFIDTWVKGDTEALFGVRALIGGTAYGWVGERVEDARIYGAVLSQDEIKKLRPDSLQVEARGKLATLWGAIKAK